MLMTQFRMTNDLDQPANPLFYEGRLVTHFSAHISNRPLAMQILQFLQYEFNENIRFPRLQLNVLKGVCCTGAGNSRYNLHNIVVTLWLIEKLLTHCPMLTLTRITIITQYRAQLRGYERASEEAAAKSDFWKVHNIHEIKVRTVYSSQGNENEAVIFDAVVSIPRHGTLGFLNDIKRQDVANTRARCFFGMICDVNASYEHYFLHPQDVEANEAMLLPI